MQNLIYFTQVALAFIGMAAILLAILVIWDERRYKRQKEEQDSPISNK